MYIRIVDEEAFFMSHEEVTAMCHRTERSVAATGSVHVRVEVNDRDWAVNLVKGSKNRKNDGVVSSETLE